MYSATLPLIACVLLAQLDPPAAARKELEPRPVTFSKPTLPLTEALAELAKQTGNRVTDQRRQKTNPTIHLPAEPTTFWPALDALAKSAGIAYSPYLADGVALIDAPYRPIPGAHAGLFRVALRRLAVNRDEETQAHHCQLALDVSWEPRFRPFYLDLRQLRATFAPDAQKKQLRDQVHARGAVSVAGRTAIELDVQTAAPDRTCPRLETLEGTVWAVGPSRMLPFRFEKLTITKPAVKNAVAQATQDGVTVTIASIRRQADALLVTVLIENPKDGPGFESHQSWLENNRVMLSHGEGARRRTLTPTGSREEMRASGARVVYEFAESAGQRLPDTLDGWRLDYETPGRIVELAVPFVLKDLRLP